MEENKKSIIMIIISAVLLAAGYILTGAVSTTAGFIAFLLAFLAVGHEVIIEAFKNIFHGEVFDECFLMTIASIGAFAIGKYPEGVAVMLLYNVGELFQDMAVDKSRDSVASLLDLRPDTANLVSGDSVTVVESEKIQVGDLILVRPGERIPLDGVITEGKSMLDTSALTGESLPRDVDIGDDVPSGCINLSGAVTLKVTRPFGDSTVSRILDMVENASEKKSVSENFITKFAHWYTPIVVIAAVLVAVIPPLVISGATFSDWIYRAINFLVVSCPCALVISVPLSFFGGIGAASRQGILVKGSNYLESLANTEIAVFDKTGTLTKGVFTVRTVSAAGGFAEGDVLRYAALAESFSSHPIAVSLRKAAGIDCGKAGITDVEEQAGHGVSAVVEGKTVLVGNSALMRAHGIAAAENKSLGTVVYVAVDGVFAGSVVISDEVREDAATTINSLHECGVKKTVMLTGDCAPIAAEVSRTLGVDEYHAELLPGGKVQEVERLMDGLSEKGKLVFTGDGVNDAPVLARADVGIAMGALGSDAAIEAADVVIMTDEPSKLATAIKLSRRTLTIVKENIIFALAVKFLVIILSAFGCASMWFAVFADVGVCILAVLNAMRCLRITGK